MNPLIIPYDKGYCCLERYPMDDNYNDNDDENNDDEDEDDVLIMIITWLIPDQTHMIGRLFIFIICSVDDDLETLDDISHR